jgi:hypothetical protein
MPEMFANGRLWGGAETQPRRRNATPVRPASLAQTIGLS